MRLVFFMLMLMLMLVLTACQSAPPNAHTIDMYNQSGDMIGTGKLSESSEGVGFKLTLEGLDPGFHGIHVHEYPTCEGPDFTSAGSHLNPEGNEHGSMHPDGPHLGDLPNIEADADGLVNAELMLPEATLMEGKKSILKGEGTSLVIQKDADDGMSQPGGDAGARIACGLIQSEKANNNKGDEQPPTDPTDSDDKQED